ncbi:ATP-binding protein [Aeromicrobium massiliense]|uniref:ATP-binding protein n=1 Tax=Aeromicrobium massiliense TaxID=1464554 RepID=UPI00030240AE|nr:ATP-binding protein [Aeromicrobium massiliense]
MSHESISIRPGVGMLNLFPHMKYQPWYALGELVDNAIQSYVANRDALREVDGTNYVLRIEISIDRTDGGAITVRDNAAGIAAAEWSRAFRVAEPPSDSSGLSQFGIGMKAACCWFARKWSVRSTALGEESSRTVHFDVPAIVEAREESLSIDEDFEESAEHFTEVRMTGLHRTPQKRTLAKIREYLGGIYRQFLRNGDVIITVNDEEISYDEPVVLNAPDWRDPAGEAVYWRKEVNIRLASGRRVTGFVAIRERGATASAGLALFYRRKVVMGAGDETYRPAQIFGASNDFRYQRVFGELHMDDFSVTYTKDALVWYDEEEEFLDLLRKHLDGEPYPLLRQAKNYRTRTSAPAPREVAAGVLDEIVDRLQVVQNHQVGDTDSSARGELDGFPPIASSDGVETVSVDRVLTLDAGGSVWRVSFKLIDDPANSRWLTVDERGGPDPAIELKVNQAHPFMRTYCELPSEGLEPVWRIAIALGLGQALARQGGAKMPGLVTEHTNAILRNYLSTKA